MRGAYGRTARRRGSPARPSPGPEGAGCGAGAAHPRRGRVRGGSRGRSCENGACGGEDVAGDRVGIPVAVDEVAAVRVLGGKRKEAVAEPRLEVRPQILEPVLAGVPGEAARQGRRGIHVDHQREVGLEADRHVVQAVDEGAQLASCRALVDAGGVGEPVGDDGAAGFERRADRLFEVIAARGGEKQDLGLAGPAVGVTLDQKAPDLLCAGRAAGFAGEDHIATRGAQSLCEPAGLRGFPGAVDAFERDEDASGHYRSAMASPAALRMRVSAAARMRGTKPPRTTSRSETSGMRASGSSSRGITSSATCSPSANGASIGPRYSMRASPISRCVAARRSETFSGTTSCTRVWSPIQTGASATIVPASATSRSTNWRNAQPMICSASSARAAMLSSPVTTKTIRRLPCFADPTSPYPASSVWPVLRPSAPIPSPRIGLDGLKTGRSEEH